MEWENKANKQRENVQEIVEKRDKIYIWYVYDKETFILRKIIEILPHHLVLFCTFILYIFHYGCDSERS